MTLKLPEIRIQSSWLLEPVSRKLAGRKAKSRAYYPSKSVVEKKIKLFERIWRKHETKLLRAMCRKLNLQFYQNVIDVYVLPYWYVMGMSKPLIISARIKKADRFVDLLTHELVHRLLSDNTRKLRVGKIFNKMFRGKSLATRNHILVHATLKYLWLEVLKEDYRLERDIMVCQKYSSYKAAWQYVEKEGYDEIIQNFKRQY